MYIVLVNIARVREEKEAGTKLADIDGSYLYCKRQLKGMTGFENATLPDVPLIGWESTDSVKSLDGAPRVTHGKVVGRLPLLNQVFKNYDQP